jgi:plasmid stabilization system protein ParE
VHRVDWSAAALEDIEALFDYLAEHASAWDADNLCKRLVLSTERLAEFPKPKANLLIATSAGNTGARALFA